MTTLAFRVESPDDLQPLSDFLQEADNPAWQLVEWMRGRESWPSKGREEDVAGKVGFYFRTKPKDPDDMPKSLYLCRGEFPDGFGWEWFDTAHDAIMTVVDRYARNPCPLPE